MMETPAAATSERKPATLRWRAVGKEVAPAPAPAPEDEAEAVVAAGAGKKPKGDDAESADVALEVDAEREGERAPPLTLEWTDVALRVPVAAAGASAEAHGGAFKEILSPASGEARPGELLAVMGPSGAGKSSLLDCLSGRNTAATGRVAVNGAPWTPQLKKLAAYALQEDLFPSTLTVQEHLALQARLRMGRRASAAQRAARVRAAMDELGLAARRDALIGGALARGLSGGERKRLAFATELLTNPSVLFVDEPTSGLDSCMAKAVVAQLKRLAARDGRTVVAAVHQPSSEVFALFDRLCLLADGATVFFGRAADAVGYFAARGLQCPTFVNPAEFFMDQLVVMDRDADPSGVRRLESLKRAWVAAPRPPLAPSGPVWTAPKVDVVVYVRVGRDLEAEAREERQKLLDPTPSAAMATGKAPPLPPLALEDRRLPFWGQVRVLAHRNALRLVRDRSALRLQVAQTLVFAALLGAIYFQLALDQQGVGNFAGAFFYIVTDQVYSASMPGIISVPLELPMVYRERQLGLYSVSAWFVAKNLCELPSQLLLPLVELVPVYLLLGLSGPHSGGAGVFLSLLALLVALNSCCVGLGYAVSCVCRRVDLAPLVGNILIMPLLLLGGLFVDVDAVPRALRWMEHVTPFKYGYYGFMRAFWRSVTRVDCELADQDACWATSGQDVLDKYGLAGRSEWHDVAALVLLGLAFRAAGLAALQLSVRTHK